MAKQSYGSISEIYREDAEEFVPPRADWEIDVVERNLSEDLGDIGGREAYVANARVQVTEQSGDSWRGLVRLE